MLRPGSIQTAAIAPGASSKFRTRLHSLPRLFCRETGEPAATLVHVQG